MCRGQPFYMCVECCICGLHRRPHHLVVKELFVNLLSKTRYAQQSFFFCGKCKKMGITVIKKWLYAHMVAGAKKLFFMLIPNGKCKIPRNIFYTTLAIFFIQPQQNAAVRQRFFCRRRHMQ